MNPNLSITSGQAATLLDIKINEPATDRQRYWLMSHGINFAPEITKLQAAKIINAAKRS